MGVSSASIHGMESACPAHSSLQFSIFRRTVLGRPRNGEGRLRRIAMRSRVFVGFEAILVAYDGSPQSQHALQIAFSLAKMASTKVLVFSVVQVPKPAPRAELNAVLDNGREGYERGFAAIREQAKETEIEVETEIAVGNPADQIIHRAETFQASLIVMGRRDKSAVQHWMGRSSSQRVLRYTRCPVMLVR
jgi:nucleotide-binding universal stress UspA family protein